MRDPTELDIERTHLLQELKKYNSCDVSFVKIAWLSAQISDALIKLGVAHGGHITDIHMFAPTAEPVIGPTFTVQVGRSWWSC